MTNTEQILSDRQRTILRALNTTPQSAIIFCERRDFYTNSWCPSFTHLRQAGLLERTGETQVTKRGSKAFVLRVTDAGRRALAAKQ